MGFGERLRQLRRDFDLTQSELANRVGCSVTMVRKIESNERRPSRELAALLARELGLRPTERADFLRDARALPVTHHAPLPSTLTRLIGREREIADLRHRVLLSDMRLLTLCGPPGVGKTRLGLQLATELQASFGDGALFIPLAALREPDLVLERIAGALGIGGAAASSLADAVIDYLSPRRVLLVLDNFEQVLPARATVLDLLSNAPYVKVVVTSREVLSVSGEHVYVVPTLGLPVSRTTSVASAAEVLFLERARAVRPNFGAATDDDAVVAEICIRLQGLPLALELAAARARVMSPRALLEALGQHRAMLDVLGAGPTDLGARQRSLRGALDWSYDMLGQHQRALFGRMACFAGGGTLEAIIALCGDLNRGAGSIERDVEALADKSLVQVAEVAGEVRFSMLEL